MHSRFYIYLGIFVGSTVGAWLGSLIDHGGVFSIWGLILGTVGAFLGVWGGYKLSNL